MLPAESIKEIRDAASLRQDPIKTPQGGFAILTPSGYGVKEFPPLEAPLTHVKAGVTLHDVPSFVDYLSTFKTLRTRIFAEPGFLAEGGKARLVGVLDYHQPEDSGSDPKPHRLAHIARYSPRYSEAWDRWVKACSKQLSQVEFAELIEECRTDIVKPSAAQLFDIVKTFKATKRVEYDSVTYQPDNSVKLHYSENVEKQGTSGALPEIMTIGIPVYYRGEPFEIDVFVRFRIETGKVMFSLKMDRADRIEDAAFDGLATNIAELTQVPVHIGCLSGR